MMDGRELVFGLSICVRQALVFDSQLFSSWEEGHLGREEIEGTPIVVFPADAGSPAGCLLCAIVLCRNWNKGKESQEICDVTVLSVVD